MKRLICLLLVLSLSFCFLGCTKEEELPEVPVKFYYPKAEMAYGTESGVIDWEWREAAEHKKDYFYLVQQYLKGPQSENLTMSFSPNVSLKKLQVIGTSARVVLSDLAALLKGLELTIACACLAATVMEITGVTSVTIQAENTLLDGKVNISKTREQIVLWDTSTGQDAS